MDTEGIGFIVESESTCTKEAMENVVKEISRVEREELHAREEEEGGEGVAAPRPRQKYHFTLIRCAYVFVCVFDCLFVYGFVFVFIFVYVCFCVFKVCVL